MEVFMLGWEFAPIKSGGLGVACRGISDGLQANGVNVTFVMPSFLHKQFEESQANEVVNEAWGKLKVVSKSSKEIRVIVNSELIVNPYDASSSKFNTQILSEAVDSNAGKNIYGHNFFQEIEKYTQEVEELAKEHQHDLIHAHDWMTYEAGIRSKAVSGKPLLVHVHATEFDRTGGNPNEYIYEKEKNGFEKADHIIVVSLYTKKILERFYGIDGDKITVIHNASRLEMGAKKKRPMVLNKLDKVILFLGRVTLQKGPEYFIDVAKRVLEKRSDVKFVIAGHGDMLPEMIQKTIDNGLQNKVIMAGHLTGGDIERAFYHADLYVMPSVSEPFGISALEAVEFGVPVLMSKTSGVSEVIHNSLKADFWDIDKMANQVLAVLEYPVLAETLVEQAHHETKYLTWKAQAEKIRDTYQKLI